METMDLDRVEGDDMKYGKYSLYAKRPHEKVFTDWCKTDNLDIVKRNIKYIKSYGYEWELRMEEDHGKAD